MTDYIVFISHKDLNSPVLRSSYKLGAFGCESAAVDNATAELEMLRRQDLNPCATLEVRRGGHLVSKYTIR